MRYLSKMTDSQTLVMYSGHPLGLFPATIGVSPRVVITNGMVIPGYSTPQVGLSSIFPAARNEYFGSKRVFKYIYNFVSLYKIV